MDATGLIVAYPAGANERLALLRALVARFAPRQAYAEREINALIRQHVHPAAADHVTVRRDLVDFQLLRRTEGGTRYWRDETSLGTLPEVLSGPGTIGPNHMAGEREAE
jgi:hypothetical protein